MNYQLRRFREGGPVIEIHIPSLLIPAAFPFSTTGPMGFVRVDRRDIGDMSPVTSPIVRSFRAKVGGRMT